jgi:hypothetical protein
MGGRRIVGDNVVEFRLPRDYIEPQELERREKLFRLPRVNFSAANDAA